MATIKMVHYFTFLNNSPYKDRFVKIEGDWSDSRKVMFEYFGSAWAFQYDEKGWINSREDNQYYDILLETNGFNPKEFETITSDKLFHLTELDLKDLKKIIKE